MTLENLLKTGQLKEHKTDQAEVGRLLEAAERSLKDSAVREVSAETRFDAAYKTVMQSAIVALMANGFTPDTKKPGHHAVAIQSLPKTIGMASDRWQVLDVLRRKRNLADYTGEPIDEGSVQECRAQASRLVEDVRNWIKVHRPELLS